MEIKDEMAGKKQFKVIVKPMQKKNGITGYSHEDNAYLIDIDAPAEKNKANRELVRFLSKELKARAVIKSGLRSREKIVALCSGK